MSLKTQRDIGLAVALIAVITLVAVVLVMSVRIHNTGRIIGIGVGVFWNPECTDETTSIDWGILRPGEQAAVTLYIKNIETSNVTLSLSTNSWNPVNASQYLTLSWNYTPGTVLNPNQVVSTQFKLTVDPTTKGINVFSFDIIITATEYRP